MTDRLRPPYWLRPGYWRAVLAEQSYRVRPYDDLADRRHWWWQTPTPCGFGSLAPAERAQLADAIREAMGPPPDEQLDLNPWRRGPDSG